MESPVEAGTTRNREGSDKGAELIAACATFIAFGNLLAFGIAPAVFSGVVVFLLCAWLGAIAAQGALHAIWCVFAPVAASKRFVIGVVLALSWYGGSVLGIAFHVGDEIEFWQGALSVLLCLPLIALGSQAPLWLARFWLRWRIVHGEDDCVSSGMTTLRIRDLMLGTAAVALALGAGRLANLEGLDTDAAFLLGLLIAVFIVAVFSAGTTLPLLIATLRARRLRFSLSVIFYVFLAIEILCVLGVALSFPVPDSLLAALFVAGFLGAVIGGYLGSLLGVLLVARNLGYRLAWGRRTSPASAETESKEKATDNMEESGG
jgi:hypothetical protein